MFKLDNDLLVRLGLGDVAPGLKNLVLRTIYEQLEMNVGFRLASRMSNHQLDEFEGFIDANDEAGARHWLEINFPDYKAVVADSLEDLQAEIRRDLSRVRTVLGSPPLPPLALEPAPGTGRDAADALARATDLPRPLTTRLLERYGSADAVLSVPDEELLAVPGLGPRRLAALRAAVQPYETPPSEAIAAG